MRAARYRGRGLPLSLEEVADPVPGPGQVLVGIRAAGVCGTDVHLAREGTLEPARSPLTLGHEGAGVVAGVGPGVGDWSAGERVTFYPSTPCGRCGPCRRGRSSLCPQARILGVHLDGTFAQAVVVPAASLVRLPPTVDFALGAILADAVATAYHAVERRARVRPGETVAIFGCGGVGHHGVMFARRAGAARVIAVDTSAGALARACEAGATDTVSASREEPARAVRALTGGEGVDVALEFVGRAATVMEAMRSVTRPGRVVVVGVGPDRVELPPLRSFVGKELALLGSMGSEREDLEAVLAQVAAGELDLAGSVTHRFPLANIEAALDTVARRTGDPVRVVVEP